MKFDTYFRACSYAMIGCGVLTLALSGGVGPALALAFAAVLFLSWKAEGTRRQLSQRAGMWVVLAALPVFYLDWRWQAGAPGLVAQMLAGVAALAHFTLLLSSIKLFQVKADRDWLFLFLISFFQVLLAAGLSLSPLFLASLGLYVFCALLAIVCFELRRAQGAAPASESRLLVANDARFLWKKRRPRTARARALARLPLTAFGLFALICTLAVPVFFLAPRAGDSAWAMAGGTASTGYVGFSDRVTLGEIGRLNENNQLVMRVRVEGPPAARRQSLRWRGVALDYFDGRRWQQSSSDSRPQMVLPNESNLFALGTTEDLRRVTTQTFFIEPIDTPVLFAAPRAVALQGSLAYVRRDAQDGLSSRPHTQERVTYRVYSDTVEPDEERLRADRRALPTGVTPNLRLPVERYLARPAVFDPRVAELARRVVREAGAANRYDMARAVEAHLGANAHGGAYTYSLQMRASGRDPLADFLFNVRAGHCEYFSTAMAVMLRSLDIPARVVNGFQSGEYNEAADAYVVRQADAHSWVEVYFPETDAWVTFDPTPVAGRPAGTSGDGLAGQLQRYADALELFWIQYVVTYDRQGQQTLARTMREGFSDYRAALAGFFNSLRSLFDGRSLGSSGGPGLLAVVTSPLVLAPLALVLTGLLVWRARGLGLRFPRRARRRATANVIEFYERMTRALAARGLARREHETPLEFARAVGTPEVLAVTRAYNSVRYGGRGLTAAESARVEEWLRQIESDKVK
jgi:transglutaminase-like putative cysteine protease